MLSISKGHRQILINIERDTLTRAWRDDHFWHHSTYCNGGSCIEAAAKGEGVALRDSESTGAPCLVFTADEWCHFLAQIKDGRLAHVD